MEKFDLSRLNASSFERLIRALCFELMGPSGIVFSSGPDGARDYTIEGQIKGYEGKGWDGYLILQAKFREKLQPGASDIQWLERQIGAELKKFKDRKAKLRRPDYYILATNVALSGTDGNGSGKSPRTGGVTKINANLATWKRSINLKDFDVWPADKLVDMLAGTTSVRQTYAAWLTTGDVLTAALKRFEAQTPDFASTMTRGLKESLRRDQHARLKDAGSVLDSPIRVSQVFIDLPTQNGQSGAVSFDFSELPEFILADEPNGVVARLANRSREKLDPDSIAAARESCADDEFPLSNKIVILGGPGQGKSTASMFVAQLFRAALLQSHPSLGQDDNVRLLVPEILDRAKKEGIPTGLPKRYPVFVALPRFADEITRAKAAHGAIPSLLSHIAGELSITCDKRIERDDLRTWLRSYPWIAIFDGLDEVPPSGERHSVLDAIASFNSEIADLQADVLVVVTTRPQGYNHDLDASRWEHWSLVDLPVDRSIAYAQALGEARYPSDPYRRKEILASITEATNKPATSRLMISPLQVTIMYLIVDTGGSVPAARWSLFNEYFEILKKREKAKGGLNQKILERNWTQLGPIHQRAGLVLQTDSEYVGGALSFLDKQRFEQMLKEFLKTCEYDLAEIQARAEELMMVALDRLVLLASREEGRLSFDVRSLQEFMAAAAMTSGNEIDIENRLNHIAGLSHWRHVFLIAASRCFSEDAFHHLRSRIIGIPRALDSALADSYVRAGATLALEMFIDGIGSDHPKSRKLLAQHALELLTFGPELLDERLVTVVEEQTSALVLNILREKMWESNTASGLAAWRLAITLSNRTEHKIFAEVAEECWPKDSAAVLTLLSGLSEPLPTQNLVSAARRAILQSNPIESMATCGQYFEALRAIKDWSGLPDHSSLLHLDFAQVISKGQLLAGIIFSDTSAPLRVRVNPIHGSAAFGCLEHLTTDNPNWTPLSAAAQFSKAPSLHALAAALLAIAESDSLASASALKGYLPWPMGILVTRAKTTDDLHLAIQDLQAGKYGTIEQWRATQDRWMEKGIPENEFGAAVRRVETMDGALSFPPLTYYQISHGSEKTAPTICSLLRALQKIQPSPLRKAMLELAQFAALGLQSGTTLGDEIDARNCLTVVLDSDVELSLAFLGVLHPMLWSCDETVSLVAQQARLSALTRTSNLQDKLPLMIAAFNRRPSSTRRLLTIIARCVAHDQGFEFDAVSSLDRSAFSASADDDSSVQLASLLLSLAYGARPSPTEAAKVLCGEGGGQKCDVNLGLVNAFFDHDNFLVDAKLPYLQSIFARIHGKRCAGEKKTREIYRKTLNARRSTLTAATTWIDELRLPKDAFTILQTVSPPEQSIN